MSRCPHLKKSFLRGHAMIFSMHVIHSFLQEISKHLEYIQYRDMFFSFWRVHPHNHPRFFYKRMPNTQIFVPSGWWHCTLNLPDTPEAWVGRYQGQVKAVVSRFRGIGKSIEEWVLKGSKQNGFCHVLIYDWPVGLKGLLGSKAYYWLQMS